LPIVAFQSAAIFRPSTLTRNNCGFDGTSWNIVIAAGAYTSNVSQADADAQANAAANALDTQANANANGSCTNYYQFAISNSTKSSHSDACSGGGGAFARKTDAVLGVGTVIYGDEALTQTLPAGYYKLVDTNQSIRLDVSGAVIEIQSC
jgi:hypothetical protein